jgi:hypothetical protein
MKIRNIGDLSGQDLGPEIIKEVLEELKDPIYTGVLGSMPITLGSSRCLSNHTS